MQLVFSAATQSALNSGAMSLMGGIRPMAVDAAGRIREVGIVTSGAAIAGPALLPIILPAAAASAAAYYQHQVLQATLDGIRDVVDRIEERLRQDDWAILETGDDLARSIVQDDANWDVPDQLRMELAVARQSVERVSRSRRRFAQRLIAQLEAEIQGRPDPWTDQVRKLVKGDHNWIEISIYLQAMVVRARLTAATAFVLATDGAARASTAMNASAVNELQKSYDPLLRALKPLADRRPDDKLFDRVPGRATGEDQFRFVGSLVTEMQSGIGSAFKGLDNDTTLVIPAHTVKALSAHVGEHPEG